MAAFIFKALLRKNKRMTKYEVSSAGTSVQIPGLSPDHEMVHFLDSKSIKGRHKSQQLTKEMLLEYDLIIPVIDECLRDAQRITQNQKLRDKIITLSEFFSADDTIPTYELKTPDSGDNQTLAKNFSTILRAEKKLFTKSEELRK
jgi:protein-tyrosine-phosphatase